LLVRRVLTLVPVLILLAVGVDPTGALVLSQVALSFGIPFALIPLVRYASSKKLMGEFVNTWQLTATAWVATVLIIAINVALIALLIVGVA
jgi:manganese transport protein